MAGCWSQHRWCVCPLEPPWASPQWVWLWRRHFPVLTLPQPDSLRRDDPRGGHAGHLQAWTVHLRRVGIRWPSLMASSPAPHVLPKVNQKQRFPWWQVSSSYERYEERAQIILQQVVAQVRHLQFFTEVFVDYESSNKMFTIFPEWLSRRAHNHDPDWKWVWKLWIWGSPKRQGNLFLDKNIYEIFIIILLLQAHLRFLKSVLRDEVGDRFLLL